MADASIGSLAGIVALASFAIKETFAFVRPLLSKKNGNGDDIRWEKVVAMMTEVKHEVADMKERHTEVLADLVQEQREFNKNFSEWLNREKGRQEERQRRDFQ